MFRRGAHASLKKHLAAGYFSWLVVAFFLEFPSSSSRTPCLPARIAELWGHIERNEEGIRNAARLNFHGSRPREKAVEVTICRRFERKRDELYVRMAYPVLGLRLLKINEEGEKHWEKKN